MYVIPAPGLRVRDPRTQQPIPPDGLEAPDDDVDFARLVTCGDLLVAAPVIAVAAKPAKAAQAAALAGDAA